MREPAMFRAVHESTWSRAVFALLVVVVLVLSCARRDGAASTNADVKLVFEKEGKPLSSIALADLVRDVPPETFTAFDPYYNKNKTYRALPVRRLLERGFPGVAPLEAQDYVLRARDGYTVPIAGARLLEAGGYIAIADVDSPSWDPIGPQQVNPGPFYFVWRGEKQQNIETYPRPWQLAAIELARFDATFPHTVPTGEPPDSPAMRGLALFRAECIHCHAVNREGGRVGPELNVPQSIVEYRPEAQIRVYIKEPQSFRYGNMPAHPNMTDAQLDALIAYFRAMKDRKYDPDGGATKP